VPLTEFDLIDRYFRDLTPGRGDVVLGIGDDCALLEVPQGRRLAVTIDTLVEGVHFARGADPESLGHKALAVNLSDLAAMGAEPAWVTLALTLPRAEANWLEGFANGFGALARAHGVALVGGDTTRGPLSITVQAHGLVEPGRELRRSGARAGDLIYVTGTLGDAGLALMVQQGLFVGPEHLEFLRRRLDRPEPRLAAGRALRGIATAAIDISDGLASDLGHVLKASGCGALIWMDRLPLSAAMRDYVTETGDWSPALSAGDDYELCLVVPSKKQAEAEAMGRELDCELSCIGMIEEMAGLRCLAEDGRLVDATSGYDHFSGGEA
jgi:thiamine-monophosphate kinase